MQRWRCAETEMTTAYLGLGSNLGDRRENLQAAVVGLVQAGIRLKKISSLYETQPIGQVEQPLFFNAVLAVETDLSPQQLLQLVLAIENNLGRQPTVGWGPRTIDIDILLYGQKTVRDLDLQIPHPYLSERAFVLVPLLEVAPDLALPDGQELRQLLSQVDCSGVKWIGDRWFRSYGPN